MVGLRPTRVEIDLDNIANNVREVRRITNKNSKLMAVVKADGYGHGAVETAEIALKNGAEWLAVATIQEGINLRNQGIRAPVLILGYTPLESLDLVVENNLSQAVYTLEAARNLSQAGKRLGRKAKIHIKLDTGMGRIGFLAEDSTVSVIKDIFSLPALEIEGIFTHFATADEKDKSYTYYQFEQFQRICNRLEEEGCFFPFKHVANSAVIIDFPEMHLDMVRAGIILYGLYPSDDVRKEKINLKPAMSLKTQVAHVKNLPPGYSISYGATFTTVKDSVIATLPIGYADGYSRLLSSKGEILVRGQKAPIVGRICMDQCMADVTHIEGVSPEDEVVLFGSQKNVTIPVEAIAEKLGTINYEVVCMVGKRVPRVYIKGGRLIKVKEMI
ncbi:MAG: alanine racemase [Thermosediminibacterales bacterium]|nr:alanine racemase [Thermosediminibacterales bacterium]MDK2836144.1 alanine racemase [Thermosediminibacterales bacterium]